MPFISFIYKIENTEKIFYGKYICDNEEKFGGDMDLGIKSIVINALNEYRSQKGLEKLDKDLCIGILSFSKDKNTYIYSSDEEIKCFDFYCINYYDEKATFLNGKLIF